MITITYIDPVEGLKTVPASECPDWVLYNNPKERRRAANEVLEDFNRHLDELEEVNQRDLEYFLSLRG